MIQWYDLQQHLREINAIEVPHTRNCPVPILKCLEISPSFVFIHFFLFSVIEFKCTYFWCTSLLLSNSHYNRSQIYQAAPHHNNKWTYPRFSYALFRTHQKSRMDLVVCLHKGNNGGAHWETGFINFQGNLPTYWFRFSSAVIPYQMYYCIIIISQ